MHTIGETIDRRSALPADSPCQEALAVFLREPDRRALAAVAEDGRPVGILHRAAFLARMEAEGAPARPLREVFEPEMLVADAAEDAAAFAARELAAHSASLLGGFVVCAEGRYEGVSDLGRLAPALGERTIGTGLIEGVCAEVREPLAHALAAAEALRTLRLPQIATVHLETIVEATHATIRTLDVAADLQKADDGRLELMLGSCRPQELMDDIEARWRLQAETAGVTLMVSYDGAPDCAVMVDAGRLMQVFDALIGHALAHSGRGVVEASLQVRPEGDTLALTGRVRDNGAAYSADYLDGLFRGQNHVATAGGAGVRLELMLAQRAMLAMEGSLEARANPGAGATVSFELACAAVDEAGVSREDRRAAPRRAAHVLVVDDNATNRMVVEALCEMFDCSTETVADGVEAVEAAKAGRFDVILMDIKMPRMDGVTAAKEIRKLKSPAGRVPIVALTANADADEVAQYLAAGMQCVVEKPIKPERLMEALDIALAERRAQPGAAAA
ncbi:MAG: response regulator [Caulobacteraceae bacterium]